MKWNSKKYFKILFGQFIIILFCICITICTCSCKKSNTKNSKKQSITDQVQTQIDNNVEIKKTEKINYTYIGNSNTKKFHLPNCRTLSQMNAENKVYLNCTRDEAIKSFKPCKRCNP